MNETNDDLNPQGSSKAQETKYFFQTVKKIKYIFPYQLICTVLSKNAKQTGILFYSHCYTVKEERLKQKEKRKINEE